MASPVRNEVGALRLSFHGSFKLRDLEQFCEDARALDATRVDVEYGLGRPLGLVATYPVVPRIEAQQVTP